MKPFMDQDFLLTNETARTLFHTQAEGAPIYDYHNHLSVCDIAEHRRFHDLTELWLEGDHYKWRAMRACGVDEACITGRAAPKEKFLTWAAVLPRLIGSPLYHWTHLELQRYFGITEPLTPKTAEDIWQHTKALLGQDGFDAVSLLAKMNVRLLCTTDDPIDSLAYHKKIRQDPTVGFAVLPTFRPDRYLIGDERADEALCQKYGTTDLLTALEKALDFFCENGCRVSDHSFSLFRYRDNERLRTLLGGLARQYARDGIVMQLHLGPLRNISPELLSSLGPDAGGDCVGQTTDPYELAAFLGELQQAQALPQTILYNLNPSDNRMLATMAGSFAPRVRYGAAWWFNDHLRGIQEQLYELMETNALASSLGMLTDSRSFTSFVRHEYFRRILCQTLGELVEQGHYPNDPDALGALVRDVCYQNAKTLFCPNIA